MSIKLVLLKSGEFVVTDIKELVSENVACGYLFKDPQKVITNTPMFLAEGMNVESEVKVSLAPWILLTEDTEIPVPLDWVITIVEPIENIKELYLEKFNGQDS